MIKGEGELKGAGPLYRYKKLGDATKIELLRYSTYSQLFIESVRFPLTIEIPCSVDFCVRQE